MLTEFAASDSVHAGLWHNGTDFVVVLYRVSTNLANKFPGEFQDTFNKFPVDIFTLIEPP